MFSATVLCIGPITRLFVVVCDPETSKRSRPWPTLGCRATEDKKKTDTTRNVAPHWSSFQLPTRNSPDSRLGPVTATATEDFREMPLISFCTGQDSTVTPAFLYFQVHYFLVMTATPDTSYPVNRSTSAAPDYRVTTQNTPVRI